MFAPHLLCTNPNNLRKGNLSFYFFNGSVVALQADMKDHTGYLVTIGVFEILSGALFIVHPPLLSQNIDSSVLGAALMSLGFALIYDNLTASMYKCQR